MSNAPSYQMQKVRFRDGADSHKFNEHIQQVFYDLTELSNLANEQEREITRIREFFEVSSYFAREQVESLEEEIASLRELVEGLQAAGNTYIKTLHTSMIQLDPNVPEWEQALVDTVHNVVTLRPSGNSSSKIYLYDELNHEYIIPNTLEVDLHPKADGLMIQENDFRHALTPDEFQFWHRKYHYNANVNEATCMITIKLPDNIISSRDVNTIYIHPFPQKTLDIVNVEYHLNGGWKPIPGFDPVEQAGNVKFCFSPMGMSEIRITLRQRHFIQKGGKNVFHMGIRDVGVLYNDYQSGIGRFDIPVTFNSAFNNKEIIGIKPIYQNEKTLSVHQMDTRLLTFKVYEVDENGKLYYLNDTFPVQIKQKRIVLKGILNLDRNTLTTPTLTGVELIYKGDS